MGNAPLLSCKDTEPPPGALMGATSAVSLQEPGASAAGGALKTGVGHSLRPLGAPRISGQGPNLCAGSSRSAPELHEPGMGDGLVWLPLTPRRSTPGWARAAAQHAQRSPARGGGRKADVGEQLSSVVPLLRTLSRPAERLHENR